ncbi:hypothetical protein E2C01_028378 [Portunus trituberculatus]|uniref:Uncharacterized protein n=1 Tax=Portunus trituberculatus TaxID=210409 RepID=A0A5B7EKG6_PORTR|nr:hypothetical protein [Portunus trituberculatus]
MICLTYISPPGKGRSGRDVICPPGHGRDVIRPPGEAVTSRQRELPSCLTFRFSSSIALIR